MCPLFPQYDLPTHSVHQVNIFCNGKYTKPDSTTEANNLSLVTNIAESNDTVLERSTIVHTLGISCFITYINYKPYFILLRGYSKLRTSYYIQLRQSSAVYLSISFEIYLPPSLLPAVWSKEPSFNRKATFGVGLSVTENIHQRLGSSAEILKYSISSSTKHLSKLPKCTFHLLIFPLTFECTNRSHVPSRSH